MAGLGPWPTLSIPVPTSDGAVARGIDPPGVEAVLVPAHLGRLDPVAAHDIRRNVVDVIPGRALDLQIDRVGGERAVSRTEPEVEVAKLSDHLDGHGGREA